MSRIASFHLVRERASRVPFVYPRLATDRPALKRVDGLHFWRLLGTGAGNNTGPSVDVRRSALFAVWEDDAALDDFMADHRIVERWSRAGEAWHVRLRSLGGHGTWRGFDPLDGMEQGSRDGAIAVVTRADVRRGAWRDFGRAGNEVDAELHAAAGLIDVVGIGEAPVGRLATFSLWESLTAARDFAYSMPRHQQVIEETRDGDWYSEELFVRFEPYGSSGTWNGRDPLAAPAQPEA
ncbi:MAG: spheroidene monooxygenase [Ilumatobacteraceae bacterium]